MKRNFTIALALASTLFAACGGGGGGSSASPAVAVAPPAGSAASITFTAAQLAVVPSGSAAASASCPPGGLLLMTASGSVVSGTFSQPTNYTNAIFAVKGCNDSPTDSMTVTSSNSGVVQVSSDAPILGFSVNSESATGSSTIVVTDTTTGATETFTVSI